MVLDILQSKFTSSRIALLSRPQQNLPMLVHVETFPPKSEKEYVAELVEESKWTLQKVATGKHRFHFLVDETPLEILFSPTDLYDYHAVYYHSNQGNILAPAFQALGFTLSEHGLHWQANKPIKRRLLVSTEWSQLLAFLGLSSKQGVFTEQQGLTAAQQLLETITKQESSVLTAALSAFPPFLVDYKRLKDDEKTLQEWQALDFASVVQKVTGLTGKPRGSVIKKLQKAFSGTWEFRKHAVSLTEQERTIWISSVLKN